jgi:hypothetical protein
MPRLRRRTLSVRLYLETLESRDLPSTVNPVPQALQPAYAQIPLSFEPNQGQTDPQVQFLSRGSGYALFLTPTEAVLSLSKPAATNGGDAAAAQVDTGDVLRMHVAGGNAAPRVVGLDRQAGTSNYLRGNNPSQWRTGIANYGKVEYQGVYPGIDLVYYGNQRQLEYDFVVAPGADPAVITLAFEGAESLALDGSGNLVLHTGAGDVVEHAPVLYQDGPSGRQKVSGSYVLEQGDRVGFRVGTYDEGKPLVIDPVLSYATYLGGSGNDYGFGIAVDSAGSAYVTGWTISPDFPTTPGAFQTTFHAASYAFVTKLNAAGSALVYSTYVGGDAGPVNSAYSIAVDGDGNAYVTGTTSAPDFPTTPGAFQTTHHRGITNDAFVVKLNPTGTGLVYGTYLGGSDHDFGYGIAIDAAGSAYVTGWTESRDFPTTPGAFQTTSIAGRYAFVTKLNAAGSALVYSTYLGAANGYSPASGSSIAVDAAGDACVTGVAGYDFPITPGAFQTTFSGGSGGDECAFLAKLNPAGTALIYSTYLGAGQDYGGQAMSGIAVDVAGNAYVTGGTNSPDFPTTPGAFQTTLNGGGDAFVVKLNPTGTALVYGTYLGGSVGEMGAGIAVDAAGNAYVTGRTDSPDFPTTPGAFQTTAGISEDAFVAKLNPAGTALLYSSFLGGSINDLGYSIAVDPSGNAYITGQTDSPDLPTTPGAFQTAYGGGFQDAFVARLVTRVPTTTALSSSANPSVYGQPVIFTVQVAPMYFVGSVPTGNVTLLDGTTVLATIPLDASGQAVFTISTLTPGSHPLTVSYEGSNDFSPSTATLTQVVSLATTTTTVSSSDPVSVYGEPVTFTATVTPDDPGAGVPTGQVAFLDGVTVLDIETLDAQGQAAFTTSDLAVGSHGILAVYSGDGNFIGRTAIGLTQVVAPPPAPSPGGGNDLAQAPLATSLPATVEPGSTGAGIRTGAMPTGHKDRLPGTVNGKDSGPPRTRTALLTARNRAFAAMDEGGLDAALRLPEVFGLSVHE